jgi:hypothetical protein
VTGLDAFGHIGLFLGLGEFVQIGRLFTLGCFLKILKQPNYLSYFFHGKIYVFILTKNRLGHILGDFFTNTSGHPAPNEQLQQIVNKEKH